ncbi:hypothetical protein CPB85DRAFT_1328534 [Mucidula mucida]|nr:hypothetical protein CPB85DRAFT_1328534 [Mucidula mucida]
MLSLPTDCPPRLLNSTVPIFISGVTKQGGPLSPLKSTLTTSLGHRWLSDLATDSEGSLLLRSSNAECGDLHLPLCARRSWPHVLHPGRWDYDARYPTQFICPPSRTEPVLAR